LTKTLVIDRRRVVTLKPVGKVRVYIPVVRAGTYPRDVFIDDLKRTTVLSEPGTVKWDDVLQYLENNNFIRTVNYDVIVDREFTTSVPTDRWEEVEEIKPITRTVSTCVGILRWAAYRTIKEDRYKRVKELLIYWTPDSIKIVDNDDLLIEFFKNLIECTPVLQRYLEPFNTVDGVMDYSHGFGYPYDSRKYGGAPDKEHAKKAVFEVAMTTAEYDDGFWEYNDYNIDEFNEGIGMIETGEMTFDDLKLRARGGKSMESGLVDVERCLRTLRTLRDVPSLEVVQKGEG
jgi:hypothetical protein